MHERGDRRLLAAIENTPLVPESQIDRFRVRVIHTDVLTDNEHEALRAASVGLVSVDAALLLGCSPDAIRSRWQTAQRKLRAKNTTHAVATAIRAGLL